MCITIAPGSPSYSAEPHSSSRCVSPAEGWLCPPAWSWRGRSEAQEVTVGPFPGPWASGGGVPDAERRVWQGSLAWYTREVTPCVGDYIGDLWL